MTKIAIEYIGDLRTRCIHTESGEEILTDAPKDNQGQGRLFSPTDLFATSWGSCVLTVMAIAAKRKGIDLLGTRATVIKEMQTRPVRRIGKLTLELFSPHSFDEGTTLFLQQIAQSCPVHASLHPDIEISFTYHWGYTV